MDLETLDVDLILGASTTENIRRKNARARLRDRVRPWVETQPTGEFDLAPGTKQIELEPDGVGAVAQYGWNGNLRGFWQAALDEERMTLETASVYRKWAAWRLVRENCLLRGVIEPEQALSECSTLFLKPSPWTEPFGIFEMPEHGATRRHILLRAWLVEMLADKGGTALLPPEANTTDWDRWVAAQREVARVLQIDKGTGKVPDAGRWGLAGLLDRDLARLAWPSAIELVEVDDEINELAMRQVAEEGLLAAEKWAEQEYGLRRHEIAALIARARRRSLRRNEVDIEEERAGMLLRLEGYICRAKEAGQMRNEIQALKLLSLVTGVNRVEKDSLQEDFLHASRQLDGEEDRGPKRLAESVEDADFKVG